MRYICETWRLTPRKQHKLRVFEKKREYLDKTERKKQKYGEKYI
jgi:hypothetical protein